MLFNSPQFLLLFLPITLGLFYFVHARFGRQKALVILAAASVAFYGMWDYRFIPLLLGSVGFNFFVGKLISGSRSKAILIFGIAINLGLLCFFKYANFFLENITAAMGHSFNVLNIALPLGLSFITFQKIAYLTDCYRGKVDKVDFLSFTLFVVFFPQLVAGPIVHHSDVIPQFRRGLSPTLSKTISYGLVLLIVGLFKKVVIADNIAAIVDPIFGNPGDVQFLDAWVGALGYSLQLYFDFAGYSEMAMGLAALFGIALPINFNSPYQATSISEFWRRWHITLGRFLREYLYIPFGGNRRGFSAMIVALAATMVLGGLWHGAGWTFVVWGAMHGAYLVAHKLWERTGKTMSLGLARALTLVAVIFAWVVFRAKTLSDAAHLWFVMLGGKGVVLPKGLFALEALHVPGMSFQNSPFINGIEIFILLLVLLFTVTRSNIHEELTRFVPTRRWHVGLAALSAVALISLSNPSSFLYWTF